MIITKKAKIGFILLAVIVFATTQYTVTHMHGPELNIKKTGSTEPMPMTYQYPLFTYHPPLIMSEDAPAIVTIVIELFTLVCYLGLKKLEPRINKAAEEVMHEFKEQGL